MIGTKQAWTRDTLKPADWTVVLPPAALAELRAAVAEIRRSPVPLFLLDPRDFALEACRATMDEVRRVTQAGPMFAVLDRLPMEEITRDEATQLYWLLSSLLARPVAQKLNGQMLFDVRDTGAQLKPGSGIRPTVTNVDLRFHNDNSYNEAPPDYVCLLCLHPAKQGGVSQVVSVATIHQALGERHPELLPRLYQPFWYDRHAEHEPDEPNTYAAPIFERGAGGALKARLALAEIHAGYELRGERMDNETAAALQAVQEAFDRPELRVELDFRPGQIQFVNNRATGHARTEFVDHPEPERKRHLVRLWLRDWGRRGYRG
jgi:alpha-ketoglutarate-dependent taurine dioxygenase